MVTGRPSCKTVLLTLLIVLRITQGGHGPRIAFTRPLCLPNKHDPSSVSSSFLGENGVRVRVRVRLRDDRGV